MKSLLISKVFPPETGGSGRWFWEIYRRLPKENYHIIAGEHPGAGDFDQSHELSLSRIPLNFSDWGCFSWNGFQQYRRAAKQVKANCSTDQFDSIHAGRILPEGWIARGLARRENIPYLCYVHGEELSYASQSRQLAYMMRKVINDSHILIANSSNTQQLLIEEWKVSDEKAVLLHPGVDTERFEPAEYDSEFQRKMNWENRKVLLTVGRLQKRKGHDVGIRAVKALVQKYPDILYSIVGDGEEKESLLKLVTELGLEGHVQFLNELEDDALFQCYQQCDLFMLPNRNINGDIEGFGMVLIEAQACGKPVLAGNSGGTRDTMNTPSTGLLIDCETPGELIETIDSLFSKDVKRIEMGAAAREWVVEKFDWKKLSLQAQKTFEAIPSL